VSRLCNLSIVLLYSHYDTSIVLVNKSWIPLFIRTRVFWSLHLIFTLLIYIRMEEIFCSHLFLFSFCSHLFLFYTYYFNHQHENLFLIGDTSRRSWKILWVSSLWQGFSFRECIQKSSNWFSSRGGLWMLQMHSKIW
jgi:hypothetical protein